MCLGNYAPLFQKVLFQSSKQSSVVLVCLKTPQVEFKSGGHAVHYTFCIVYFSNIFSKSRAVLPITHALKEKKPTTAADETWCLNIQYEYLWVVKVLFQVAYKLRVYILSKLCSLKCANIKLRNFSRIILQKQSTNDNRGKNFFTDLQICRPEKEIKVNTYKK